MRHIGPVAEHRGDGRVTRVTCQVCEHQRKSEQMETHHIVPTEVSEEGGTAESQTVELCDVCHRDAHSWYRGRVARSRYDEDTKRFIAKSALEMVREYQTTFDAFVAFKAAQRPRTRRR